jgi:transcriptional regulator with XRE-family HTH domain
MAAEFSPHPFASNLVRLMERAGVSTAQLAAETGHSVRAVQTWRKGTRTPRLDALPLIAGRLGCDVSELVEGLGGRPAPATEREATAGASDEPEDHT